MFKGDFERIVMRNKTDNIFAPIHKVIRLISIGIFNYIVMMQIGHFKLFSIILIGNVPVGEIVFKSNGKQTFDRGLRPGF